MVTKLVMIFCFARDILPSVLKHSAFVGCTKEINYFVDLFYSYEAKVNR